MSQLSMYEQVLGAAYARLPSAVQRFHRLSGSTVLEGWVETRAPETLLARALAACLGVPRSSSSGPLRFELQSAATVETWTRHFPTNTMTSRMSLVAGRIEEHLGLSRLTFSLDATEEKLSMRLESLRFCGVPCPAWLMPRVVAEEKGVDDQIHFHVTAGLPLIGTVASYTGYLVVRTKELA